MSLVALPCIATYQYQVFRSDVLKFKANVSYLVIGKTREEISREVIGRNPQVAMDESSVLLQDTWRIYLFHEMSIIYGAVDETPVLKWSSLMMNSSRRDRQDGHCTRSKLSPTDGESFTMRMAIEGCFPITRILIAYSLTVDAVVDVAIWPC